VSIIHFFFKTRW